MRDDDFTDMGFMVELTDDEVRLLLHCVSETLKNWPGTPARPREEQEMLWNLKDNFFRMVLEMQFDPEA